ncbi:MAG: alpha/beta fold hydrolase [Alphaproteobacteria bacterium]|nr:alpha/beta fold hydrolase [Alphaproteobacteria bacterium]
MARKTPLVLLPGLLCDAALWHGQIAGLADVAESSVADLTRDDSLMAMARRVLQAAPPQFALAGLSMGGYCAFEVMRQAPERVLRLALLDTGARADTPEQMSRRRGLIELAEKGEFKGVTPRLLPLLVHPDRLKEKELVGAVMTMAERIGKDAFLRQQKAIMGRIDSRPSLANIKCPTLVLCGREDVLTPRALAEEIAAFIPGARLDLIDHCGHLSAMERPEAVTAELRQWLTD